LSELHNYKFNFQELPKTKRNDHPVILNYTTYSVFNVLRGLSHTLMYKFRISDLNSIKTPFTRYWAWTDTCVKLMLYRRYIHNLKKKFNPNQVTFGLPEGANFAFDTSDRLYFVVRKIQKISFW